MRSRRIFRWLLPAALVLLVGCGDSGQEAPAPAEAAASMPLPSVDRSASAVQLTLDGVHEVLTGGARLEVRELNPVVHLVVTTVFASNHDDLLELDLTFEGVENAVGSHSSELGGQSNSPAFAVAYLERISYLSQSGSLDVTLTGDGAIHGRFDAELAVDAEGSSDPTGIPASAVNFNLSGAFEGTWSLLCRSPVLALPGDHSVADSPYCNQLEF
jgi:hypothetical protein